MTPSYKSCEKIKLSLSVHKLSVWPGLTLPGGESTCPSALISDFRFRVVFDMSRCLSLSFLSMT